MCTRLALLVAFSSNCFGQVICFEDVSAASGIDFVHNDGNSGKRYLFELMAAGVASFDYDADGLIDIIFLSGCQLPSPDEVGSSVEPANPLYRNVENGTFEIASKAFPNCAPNYSLGVAVADYNNDGFSDVYVSNFGANQLWINNGDGTFHDTTHFAGVADGQEFGAGVVFSDIDGDGDLDLFVGNYVDFDFQLHEELMPRTAPFPPGPKDFSPAHDSMFINRGDGTFVDISASSGIAETAGPSMGAVAGDFDQDGDPDIFVACDGEANRLYQNEGAANFTEVALSSGVAFDILGVANGSMGVDVADLDHDGFEELLVTDYTTQFPMLFQNFGGIFEDITRRSRVGTEVRPHVNWAAGLIDFDCDQDRDAFICNGHLLKDVAKHSSQTDFAVRNSLMENLGNMRFRSATDFAGAAMDTAASSRGAVFEDFNLDGKIDVAILNCNSSAQLLFNCTSTENQWLKLNLRGRRANRDAVGARVKVSAGDKVQYAEVRSGRSYQSHFGSQLHFGLGKEKKATLEVLWPDGEVQVLQNVSSGQTLTVVQP